MASKAQKERASVEEAEELLDELDKALERLKFLYEQYFLGIQKQAPGPLHSEVERRIRDLLKTQLRSTAHRYRFVTLQQKFSSYNAYWRRTVRQIESGKYARNLAKIGRNAIASGEEIPEEILAAMPKRMREQVVRDREAAIARMKRRGKLGGEAAEEGLLELGAEDFVSEGGTSEDSMPPGHTEAPLELSEDAFADAIAMIKESTELRRQVKNVPGPHRVTAADAELDINAFFASVEAEENRPAPSPDGPPNPVRHRSVTRGSAVPEAGAKSTPPVTPVTPPTRATPLPMQAQQPPAQPPPPTEHPPTQPPETKQPSFLPSRTSPGIQPMAKQAQAQQFGTMGKLRPSGQIPAIPAIPSPAGNTSEAGPPASSSGTMPASPPTRPSRPSQRFPAVTTSSGAAAPPTRPSAPIQVQVGRDTPPEGVGSIPERRPSRTHPITEQSAPPDGAIDIATTPSPSPMAAAAARRNTGPRPRIEPSDVNTPPPRVTPPPGMTEGDVNALYAKYVKAKEMVGEAAGPGAYGKLLKTINAQAPKIMEQYKAKGVDFQIVVKDNQVIIRAKPKP